MDTLLWDHTVCQQVVLSSLPCSYLTSALDGGQAQYVRVPFADFNCLKLPAGTEHEDDFILL